MSDRKYKHSSFSEVRARGNVTADPKFSDDGTPFLSFQIAVDEFYQSQGQQQKRTHFFGIVAYGDVAERGQREVFKGAPVEVSGKLRSDEMGRGDVKERKTRIHAHSIRCMIWADDQPEEPPRSRASRPAQQQQRRDQHEEEDCPF